MLNEIKTIKKEWGEEKIIVNTNYCGKLLLLKRGFRCSFHCHKSKDEMFYIYRGKVLMKINDKDIVMNQGDSIHIIPHTYHSFTGLTDAEIIEFSSYDDPSDSFRKDISCKVNFRKAYDYDGVINIGLVPEKGAPIITSRTFEEYYKIKLKDNPIYFNPVTYSEKTSENGIKWKAEMINRLKIEIFYEDTPETIVALQKLCPKCHIEKVDQISSN